MTTDAELIDAINVAGAPPVDSEASNSAVVQSAKVGHLTRIIADALSSGDPKDSLRRGIAEYLQMVERADPMLPRDVG
ncbi:hypothetical protein AB0M43_32290 [Longispora sp. NPDC051575]|uniref:hypothetical protein n=1 Tax=Longispora sp. NPDC051575 TaxID=3154943 RepID=UPI00343E1F96